MSTTAIVSLACDRCGLWYRGTTPRGMRAPLFPECRRTRPPGMLDNQLARDLAALIAATQEARWALRVGRPRHALDVLERLTVPPPASVR